MFFLPPYAPEMNLIEPAWKEVRKRDFGNEMFSTLALVVGRLQLSAELSDNLRGL